MPGMAGLSRSQPAGQNNVMNTGQTFPLLTTQGTNQYTNTNQTSSNNQPFFLLNPAFYESVPGNVASTFGGLVKGAFSPEDFTPAGFTHGAAPTAGGQFPYNYPITQTDINRIISGNPALWQSMQNQYNLLSYFLPLRPPRRQTAQCIHLR